MFGIIDSTSGASAALSAAIIRGYCNEYTHIKVGGLIVKKCRQILAKLILKILDRLSGVESGDTHPIGVGLMTKVHQE